MRSHVVPKAAGVRRQRRRYGGICLLRLPEQAFLQMPAMTFRISSPALQASRNPTIACAPHGHTAADLTGFDRRFQAAGKLVGPVDRSGCAVTLDQLVPRSPHNILELVIGDALIG